MMKRKQPGGTNDEEEEAKIKSIVNVLLRKDLSEVSSLMNSLKRGRELAKLLDALLAICQGEHANNFALTPPVLAAVDRHFQQQSPLAAHEHAQRILDLLKEASGCRCASNLVLMLRSLLEHVPLLSANRLRVLIRGELLEQCTRFWVNDQLHLAAHLCLCILQMLLMELAYTRALSTEKSQQQLRDEAQAVWARLLAPVQNFENSAFLQLSTLLLLNAILVTDEEKKKPFGHANEKEEEAEPEEAEEEEEEEAIRKWSARIVRGIRRQKLLEKCTEVEEATVAEGQQVREVQPLEEGGEEADQRPVECTYNSALYHLLSRNLHSFWQLCSPKSHLPIIQFMVTYAQRHNCLDQLLHSLAKNPFVRFDQLGLSIEQALLQLLPSSSAAGFCAKAGGSIRWAKLAGENCTKMGVKRRRRHRSSQIDDPPPAEDWAGLLAIFEDTNCPMEEQEDRLGLALAHISNAKLDQILSNGPTQLASAAESPESAQACLRLLHSFAVLRKSLTIPLHGQLADLVMAEPEPRTYSLLLGAQMLRMYANKLDTCPQLPDFCSMCLALFQPYDLLLERANAAIEEQTRRQFLMAQLDFLRSLLHNQPKLLGAFAPLIVQLLPDFFVQVTNYRREMPGDDDNDEEGNSWRQDQFADRFEHSLNCLCRALAKCRKSFQRLLPCVLANCLSGERQMRLGQYLLMSCMDANDFALLSTNLPLREKKMFGQLQSQFYEANKIIG